MIPLSYTFLRNWDNCPHKAYRIHIKRDLPKEDTEELRWGNRVHDAFKGRINNGTPLPKEMESYERFCSFGNYVVKAEVALGIRENGEPCGFFDSDVWLRVRLDVLIVQKPILGSAYLFDWKTGKRREDAEELEIQAVALKAKHPNLESIRGRYVWLKDGELGKEHDLSKTKEKLESLRDRSDEIAHAVKMEWFPKRQNPLCGWCPVEDCEFNRRGK